MKKLILQILKESEDKIFDKDYNQIEKFFKRKIDSGQWGYESYGGITTLYNEQNADLEDYPYNHIVLEIEDSVLWVTKGLIDVIKNITGEPWSYNKFLVQKYIENKFNIEIETVLTL